MALMNMTAKQIVFENECYCAQGNIISNLISWNNMLLHCYELASSYAELVGFSPWTRSELHKTNNYSQ